MSHIHLPHDHGHNNEELILAHLPKAEQMQDVAELLKQLSDGTRIRIFWILCHCEECVMNLSAMMEMTSPAVSHHLKQLKSAELIVGRREGKEVYYKAVETRQVKLLHEMIETFVEMNCPLSGS